MNNTSMILTQIYQQADESFKSIGWIKANGMIAMTSIVSGVAMRKALRCS